MNDNTVEGYLYYPKIPTPGLKYGTGEKHGTPPEYVWEVDVCVPKDVAKAWSKKFSKQKHKEFDREEFERIFLVAPPTDDETLYTVKLKKETHYRDKESGELVPIPEQYHPKAFTADGEEITEGTLIGNGSKGVVAFNVNTNAYGSFAKLSGVRVDELVEYVRPVTDAKAALFGGKPKASGAKPKRATPPPAVDEEKDDPFP